MSAALGPKPVLEVVWRKNAPVSCSGCKTVFVPKDGPVLGVDEAHPDAIWPVIECEGCHESLGVGPAHVLSMVIR